MQCQVFVAKVAAKRASEGHWLAVL